MTFASWMKAERRERGLTQLELAEQAGLGRTYINNIENGRVKLPNTQTRGKIHYVFGTDDGQLEDLGVLILDQYGDAYLPPDAVDEPAQNNWPPPPFIPSRNIEPIEDEGEPIDPNSVEAELIGLVKRVRWNDERASGIRLALTNYIELDRKKRKGEG